MSKRLVGVCLRTILAGSLDVRGERLCTTVTSGFITARTDEFQIIVDGSLFCVPAEFNGNLAPR